MRCLRAECSAIHMGNLKAGKHELVAVFTGRGPAHCATTAAARPSTFEKGIGAKYIELTISDRESKQQPEFVRSGSGSSPLTRAANVTIAAALGATCRVLPPCRRAAVAAAAATRRPSSSRIHCTARRCSISTRKTISLRLCGCSRRKSEQRPSSQARRSRTACSAGCTCPTATTPRSREDIRAAPEQSVGARAVTGPHVVLPREDLVSARLLRRSAGSASRGSRGRCPRTSSRSDKCSTPRCS